MKSSADGISDKVLSEALDDLQESGLVVRDVVEDKPVRVHHSLTPAGRDLDPSSRGYWSGTTSISARVADRSDGSP